MTNRMLTNTADVYAAMMKLRKERKEFMGNDLGTFYRTQKLLAMIRNGYVTLDNLSEWMNAKKLSDDEIPVDWYHLTCFPHPQQIQMDLVGWNHEVSNKKFNKRGRVTKLRLRKLLFDILQRRVDMYENPDKYMNNKILCIVGESGAGKTLASLHLQNKLGANVICSYTTRPPRETEVEGREHHFINLVPDPNELLAYTTFGGYEYYALKTQVFGDCTVYVVDEEGLKNLKLEHGEEYRIFSVYMTRAWSKRRRSGVTKNRLERDFNREKLDLSEYDWLIENNSTKKEMFVQIEAIYNQIKNMK